MDGRKKPKSANWYEAVKRANQARRGEERPFSLKRSETMKKLWRSKAYGAKLRSERKLRWDDESFRVKQIERMLSEEVSKSHSRKMKLWWKEHYEEMCQKRKAQV